MAAIQKLPGSTQNELRNPTRKMGIKLKPASIISSLVINLLKYQILYSIKKIPPWRTAIR